MSEPHLFRVTLVLCDLCLRGKGGECNTPGCALWMSRAPDLNIRAKCQQIESLETEAAR